MKFDDLDLKPGAPVKKLELAHGKTYIGNAVDKFVDAKLFNREEINQKLAWSANEVTKKRCFLIGISLSR